MVNCSKCGSLNLDEANFCQECGFKIINESYSDFNDNVDLDSKLTLKELIKNKKNRKEDLNISENSKSFGIFVNKLIITKKSSNHTGRKLSATLGGGLLLGPVGAVAGYAATRNSKGQEKQIHEEISISEFRGTVTVHKNGIKIMQGKWLRYKILWENISLINLNPANLEFYEKQKDGSKLRYKIMQSGFSNKRVKKLYETINEVNPKKYTIQEQSEYIENEPGWD